MWANCLYRLYDSAGELLYLGLTHQPRNRLKAHWRTKPWRDEVHSATFEPIPPRRPDQVPGWHRFEAEMAAIVREQPKYNIAGISQPAPGHKR